MWVPNIPFPDGRSQFIEDGCSYTCLKASNRNRIQTAAVKGMECGEYGRPFLETISSSTNLLRFTCKQVTETMTVHKQQRRCQIYDRLVGSGARPKPLPDNRTFMTQPGHSP
jgi:hypothetical protein